MLGQVVHQQPGHLELVDEIALLVGGARAVGVTIEEQAHVVATAGQDPQRLVDVRPDRLGIDPTEIRIPFGVDLANPDLAAGQEPRQPFGPGAVHRVDEDAHVGGLERIEINRPADVLLVARIRVVPVDEAGGLGVRERPARNRRPAVRRDRRLEDGQDLGARCRAGRCLDLEAVVGPRVVAGRDHDSGRRAALDNLVRRHLGRNRVARKGDRNVLGHQDFCGGGGEMLGGEAPVVGDDDALGLLAPADDVLRDPVGATPDALERVVVGDLRPPAIGAEDDLRWLRDLADRGH